MRWVDYLILFYVSICLGIICFMALIFAKKGLLPILPIPTSSLLIWLMIIVIIFVILIKLVVHSENDK